MSAHAVRQGGIAEDPVYSSKQAAEMLGVCAATLQMLRIKGGGPEYLRVGTRKVGYRASALSRFIDARSFSSSADEASRRHA